VTDIERLADVARKAAGLTTIVEIAIDAGAGAIVTLDFEGMVRAVLLAAREPTESQYDALCATDKMWRDLDSKTVWQTYIDALLKG
jgi:hypothetical protein